MIRILHAADLHLDSPFEGLPEEKAALRRAEQRELLRELAQLRAESGAQLVLLPGDIFDSSGGWAGTEDQLRRRRFSSPREITTFTYPAGAGTG